MSLGDGITTSGIVRVVVKVTDDAIGPDMGITLHEAEPAAPWNDAMAIMMFDFAKNSNGGIHLAGYSGGSSWDWETNVKAVEKGKEIVLWLSVDAENNTHGLSAQMEGETEVTTVYTNYGSRSSEKGQPSDNAKFCSVFVNDKDGQLTTAIEIIKDAEIVDAIEAYTFGGTSSLDSEASISKSVTVFPTMAQDYLNISSKVAVTKVRVISLTGQEVMSATEVDKIDVSALTSGTYIVEVKTINNAVSVQKFLKK